MAATVGGGAAAQTKPNLEPCLKEDVGLPLVPLGRAAVASTSHCLSCTQVARKDMSTVQPIRTFGCLKTHTGLEGPKLVTFCLLAGLTSSLL